MSAVLFFIAAIGVITGATGVVVLRDAFYSVLSLVVHLISLAVLFLLLRAEFVAAAQVVVYAGAVMVLYVFVVAYVGGEADSLGERLRGPGPIGSGLRRAGAVIGAALLLELLIALLGTGLEAIEGKGAGYSPGPRTFGTPAYIAPRKLTGQSLQSCIRTSTRSSRLTPMARSAAPRRRTRSASSPYVRAPWSSM